MKFTHAPWPRLRDLAFRFVRMAFLLPVGIWIGFGLLSGSAMGASTYDPGMFAIGIAALLAFACTFMAFLIYRNRVWRGRARRMTERCERMSDQMWQLQEAEQRSRAFLESQGDLIVRRRRDGVITFVNDAFSTLAARDAALLNGSEFSFEILEQGEDAILSDGGRMHDQKIATASGARWIAWREGFVRGESGETEIQGVGRDVTDRACRKRHSAKRAIWRKPPTAPSRVSWRWCRTRFERP